MENFKLERSMEEYPLVGKVDLNGCFGENAKNQSLIISLIKLSCHVSNLSQHHCKSLGLILHSIAKESCYFDMRWT